MDTPLHAINWFEIPVLHFERAQRFYNAIFECEMTDAQVGNKRMGFFPYQYQNEGIGGAIVQAEGFIPSRHGSKVYLNGGDNLEAVLSRVPAANGKVLLPKTFVNKEVGYYASFEDTEGNEVYLHSRN